MPTFNCSFRGTCGLLKLLIIIQGLQLSPSGTHQTVCLWYFRRQSAPWPNKHFFWQRWTKLSSKGEFKGGTTFLLLISSCAQHATYAFTPMFFHFNLPTIMFIFCMCESHKLWVMHLCLTSDVTSISLHTFVHCLEKELSLFTAFYPFIGHCFVLGIQAFTLCTHKSCYSHLVNR